MGKFRVRELAKERGINQEELSKRSGVKLSTVQRVWQNKGASEPRTSTMRNLALALGVSIEDLYTPGWKDDDEAPMSSSIPVNKMDLAYQGIPS